MAEHVGEFVSREEFVSFEKRVVRGFSDIGNQITELRGDIKAASRGPDLKLIVSTLGVFAMIVAAIGSIVAWGLKEQNNALGREIQTLNEHTRAHESDLQSLLMHHVEGNARNEGATSAQLRALEREVFERSPRRCGPNAGGEE